jgi:hypothetical protein
MNDHMSKLKAELEEYIATGYDYEALVDIGNGWEPYQGCFQNLLMILEDPDTTVEKSTQTGVVRYLVTLPSWWRKGAIAVDFDEADL